MQVCTHTMQVCTHICRYVHTYYYVGMRTYVGMYNIRRYVHTHTLLAGLHKALFQKPSSCICWDGQHLESNYESITVQEMTRLGNLVRSVTALSAPLV